MKRSIIIEGKFNSNPENELVFGSKGFISLDSNSIYFDINTVNESFNRIMKNAQFYWYHPCNITNTNGVILNTFSDDMASVGWVDRIIDHISDLTPEHEGYISLLYHLRGDIKEDKLKTNFWWDIENDFMFFFGARDRTKEFISKMQNERDLYNKHKMTLICVRPPFQKNGCNCATFDEDGECECAVTGDRCMWFRPSAIACAKEYGEGPLANFY